MARSKQQDLSLLDIIMAELLTQLQDQIDSISRKFFETVGVLQRDAPPVSTSGEPVITTTSAAQQQATIDVQSTVKRMTEELLAQFKATDELLQLLPDTNTATTTAAGGSSGGGSDSGGGGMVLPLSGTAAAEAAEAAFRSDIQQLQAQHEAVAGQLTAAVEEMEALLLQLQQLYAAQAHATLAAGPLVPPLLPPKQEEQPPK